MKTLAQMSPEELRQLADLPPETAVQEAKKLSDMSEFELRELSESSQGQSFEGLSGIENLQGGLNQGLSNAAGFPVDAVSSAGRSIPALIPDQPLHGPGDTEPPDLDPDVTNEITSFFDRIFPRDSAGGSGTFRRGLEALGFPTEFEPGSIPGNIGLVVGESAPFGGGAVAGAQRGVTPRSFFRGGALDEAATNPAKFLLSETALSAGAGTARGVAEKGGFDSPLSLAGAEIVGGLSTSSLMDATRMTATFFKGMWEPFSFEGAERAVARDLQIRATDPVQAHAQLGQPPPIPAPFLSGALSQDFGLLALERSIIREGDTGELLAREAEVNEAIRAQLRELLGREAPDALVNHVRSSFERQGALLDQRVRIAVAEAERAIRELPPIKDADILESMSSRVFRGHLDKALRDARTQESDNWRQALGGTELDTTGIKGGFESLDAQTLKGDTPIPGKIRRAINKLGQKAEEASDEFPEGVEASPLDSIDEVQSVRSLILRHKRLNKSSPAPDEDLNRRLTELDQIMLHELSKQAQDPQAMDRARRFSKKLNDTFTRGKVGEILAYDSRGGAAVHPALTIQAAFDTGNAGRINFQQLQDAASSPEARQSLDRFLNIRFAREVLNADGSFNTKAADRWLNRHQGIMDLFPELREKFRTAKNKFDLLGDAELARTGATKEFERSRAALFLGVEDPVRQVAKVLDGDSPNAGMDELIELAAQDTSGAAHEGLKSAFAMALIRKVSKRTTDVDLEKSVSEAKLDTFLESQMRNVNRLYGRAGAERVKRILDGVRLLILPEKARKTKIGSDTFENLQGSYLLTLIGRVVGVRLASSLSVKGPGQIQQAAIASNLGRRLGDVVFRNISGDRQHRILIDAFEDPELMRTLLLKKLPENEGVVRERLRTHMIAAGIYEDEDDS